MVIYMADMIRLALFSINSAVCLLLQYSIIRYIKNSLLERKAYNEIPPRVEYRLTDKGQELVESVIGLLQWMRKWSLLESG